MSPVRNRRRKEDRPSEITAAAMDEFAQNGYDATRVEAVAARAGVSKGLLYLYFKTKEELFKAVVRSFVTPKLQALQKAVDQNEHGVEAFLRGPFLKLVRELPRSRARHLVRLMIAEGPKHPDLTRWYWENVVSKGIAALRSLVASGVRSGELKPSSLETFPQLLMAPVMFSMIWTLIMQRHSELDTDAFIEANIDLLLTAVRNEAAS